MRKISLTIIFAYLLTFVACNNKNNNPTFVAPPPLSNQCLLNQGNYYGNNGLNVNPYGGNLGYNYGYGNAYGTPYGGAAYGTPNGAGYNGAYGYQNNYGTAYGTAAGTCNSQLYNNYYQYGFAAYPNLNIANYNYATGGYNYVPLCDCPANYRPVYNGSIGLGCVSAQYFNPISVGTYYYALTPSNYQWVNWTQVSNTATPTSFGNQTNCYQQVALSCFTDQPNSCGNGSFCRATAGGSRLGICSNQ